MKRCIHCVSLLIIVWLPPAALAAPSFSGRPGDAMPGQPGMHTTRLIDRVLPDGADPARPARSAGSAIPAVAEVDPPIVSTSRFELGWQLLESQSDRSRAHTRIGLRLRPGASSKERTRAQAVEALWESGAHAAAIAELRQLEAESAPVVSVTQQRTAPSPADAGGLGPWGTDVVIDGDFDPPLEGVERVCLETDPTTGNLLALVAIPLVWSMNVSTDGGATWFESLRVTGFGSNTLIDLDCTVAGDAFFTFSVRAETPREVRWYSVNSITGSHDADGTVAIFPAPIRDISAASNSEEFDNRLYVMAVLDDDTLDFRWSDETAATWAQIVTPVTDAAGSVDVVYNPQFDVWALFIAYKNTAGDVVQLQVDTVLNWDTTVIGPGSFPSIAAYDDRVMVVYVDGVAFGVDYWVSYNAGDSWFFGTVAADGPDNSYRRTAVTGIQGAGFRVGYIDERGAGPVDALVTHHRDYGTGPGQAFWSGPLEIDDDDPYTQPAPSIQWVPDAGAGDAHGALWIRDGALEAVFDRSDGATTSVSEAATAGLQAPAPTLSAWPSPYRSGQLNVLLRAADGIDVDRDASIAMFDVHGRLVRRLTAIRADATELTASWDGKNTHGETLAAGAYFLRAEVGGVALPSRKLMVVR